MSLSIHQYHENKIGFYIRLESQNIQSFGQRPEYIQF